MQVLYIYLAVCLIILLSALISERTALIDKDILLAVLELLLVWPVVLPLFICYFVPYLLVCSVETLIYKIKD